MGLDAIAPGAGQAAQVGVQLASAPSATGQLAGIGVEGLLETFGLNDTPLADPSKSAIGRVALGFADAHPTSPNTAGQSAPPLKPEDAQQQQGPGAQGPQQQIGVNIEEMHVQDGDGEAAARVINRTVNQYPFQTR